MKRTRPPRAMVLAAGLGSRLGSLTDSRAKPMLPICGTPLVRWAVLWLRHHGIREIVVNLHHLGHQIEAELGDGRDLGVAIAYSREQEQLLGTGGGLRHARSLLDDGREEPIVVINGKLLTEQELGPVLAFHRARRAEATMVLRADPRARKWGSLRVDAAGKVVELLGERLAGARPEPDLMFTGIHLLQPRFLDRIPAEGPQCVIRTAYTALFREARGLFGYCTDRYWWEHSTPERYLEGVFNVLRGQVTLPYAEHPLVGIDPSAEVSGAEIVGPVWIGRHVRLGHGSKVGPLVQIGSGAVIEPGCRVERAVVWPGARVVDSVHEAIVAP